MRWGRPPTYGDLRKEVEALRARVGRDALEIRRLREQEARDARAIAHLREVKYWLRAKVARLEAGGSA